MKGAHQKQFRCLFPTCTHRKSVKPSFRLSPQSFRKVVRPPFDILNYTQKQGGTQTNRGNTLTLKKAHHVQTVTKIEGSDIQLIPQFLSLHFSQHILLPKSHSLSMLRERLQERGYRRCARNPQKKTCPHFLPSHRPPAAANRASWAAIPPHISQLRRRVTVRRAFSSAIMWRPIKAHAFTVSAGMQGPRSNTFPRVQIRTNTSPQRFVSLSLAPCLSRPEIIKNHDSSSLPSSLPPSSVAIVAQAISCSNVRGGFPVDELFWF